MPQFLIGLAATFSGLTGTKLAVFCLLCAGGLFSFNLARKKKMDASALFALGMLGIWLSFSVLGASMLWSFVASGQWIPVAVTNAITETFPGPMEWASGYSISFDQRVVRYLQFRGANSSDKEVALQHAFLTSAITGERVNLFVDVPEKGFVPLNQVSDVPPKARIVLQAEFDPPSGMALESFLKNWRQFYLNVDYAGLTYRHLFDERQLSVFFPQAGPHVSLKVGP